jgi:hypothetical protein
MDPRRRRRWIARILFAVALLAAGMLVPAMWLPVYTTVSTYLVHFGDAIAAIALSAQALIFIVSAYYAGKLYRETRETAARNNTLQLIFAEHTDKEVAAQRKLYRSIRDDEFDRLENYDYVESQKARDKERWKPPPCPAPCTPPEYHAWVEEKWAEHWKAQEKNWRERQDAIIAVMNRYEAFAIGIQTGAVDPSMYRRWWKSQLINDWHSLRKLVETLQRKTPNAYIEFQSLAQKWIEEDTKEKAETAKN